MGRKGHTPEQIVRKLREAEAAQATGCTVVEACRQIGISEQTYYRWRNAYGKMEMDQLRRLKALEGVGAPRGCCPASRHGGGTARYLR